MERAIRDRASALFAALGNPTRLNILEFIGDREVSVNEISEGLGLGQSSVSQHLAPLYRSGVLKVTPRGTSRLYKIRGRRIHVILDVIQEFCEVQGLKGEPSVEADEA